MGDDRGMSEQVPVRPDGARAGATAAPVAAQGQHEIQEPPAPENSSVAGRVSSYARGSVANMVRSLVVIGAIMALLYFMVARTNSVATPDIDIPQVATPVARETGWPIEVPVDLPDGWAPSAVRYVPSTDGLQTWHVGYTSPAGHYVAVEQTKEPTEKWVRQQVNHAPKTGTLQAGGRTWDTFVRDQKTQNSLVTEGPEPLTTVVTGDGTFAELQLFAEHLKTYVPPAS